VKNVAKEHARRPNGPTVSRTVGALGRHVEAMAFAPRGVALGWANGWAFGPQSHCQEFLPRPNEIRTAYSKPRLCR
jgi:hypothetical protein